MSDSTLASSNNEYEHRHRHFKPETDDDNGKTDHAILTLPEDLLLRLPLYVAHRPTLAALASTCQHLNKICAPLLWDHLVVGPEDFVPPVLRSPASSRSKVEADKRIGDMTSPLGNSAEDCQLANLRYVKRITLQHHHQHFCQPLNSVLPSQSRSRGSQLAVAVAPVRTEGTAMEEGNVNAGASDARKRKSRGELGCLANVKVVEIRIDRQYDYHQVPLVPIPRSTTSAPAPLASAEASSASTSGAGHASSSTSAGPSASPSFTQSTSTDARSAAIPIPSSQTQSGPGSNSTSGIHSLPRRYDDRHPTTSVSPAPVGTSTSTTTSISTTTATATASASASTHTAPTHRPAHTHTHTARCRPSVAIEPCHILRAIDPKTLILRYPDFPLSKLPSRRHPRLDGLKFEELVIVTPANSILGGSPVLEIVIYWRRLLKRIVWIFIPSKSEDTADPSECRPRLTLQDQTDSHLDIGEGKGKGKAIDHDDSFDNHNEDGKKPTKAASPTLSRPALYSYFYDVGKCIKFTRADLFIVNGDHLVRQATNSLKPAPVSGSSGDARKEEHTVDVDTGFMERALRKGLEASYKIIGNNNPNSTPQQLRDTQGQINFITLDQYLAANGHGSFVGQREGSTADVEPDWRDMLDIDEVNEWRKASR
ncbi:hypothetical protein IAU59_005167 [Kwoniella sp. CBS 9459]